MKLSALKRAHQGYQGILAYYQNLWREKPGKKHNQLETAAFHSNLEPSRYIYTICEFTETKKIPNCMKTTLMLKMPFSIICQKHKVCHVY